MLSGSHTNVLCASSCSYCALQLVSINFWLFELSHTKLRAYYSYVCLPGYDRLTSIMRQRSISTLGRRERAKVNSRSCLCCRNVGHLQPLHKISPEPQTRPVTCSLWGAAISEAQSGPHSTFARVDSWPARRNGCSFQSGAEVGAENKDGAHLVLCDHKKITQRSTNIQSSNRFLAPSVERRC